MKDATRSENPSIISGVHLLSNSHLKPHAAFGGYERALTWQHEMILVQVPSDVTRKASGKCTGKFTPVTTDISN
jgi:hypothetical protein